MSDDEHAAGQDDAIVAALRKLKPGVIERLEAMTLLPEDHQKRWEAAEAERDAARARVAELEGALIKGAARVARLAHDPELPDDVSEALTRQAGELRAAVKARRLLGGASP